MRGYKKIIVTLIIVVLFILIAIFFIIKNSYVKNLTKNSEPFIKEDINRNNMKEFGQNTINETIEITEKTNRQVNKETKLKANTQIKSALSEDIELHAIYYLAEVYVEENQFVEAGANILKYTNGTYLVAPYDGYITKLNLPDLEGMVLNDHYIEFSSSNLLKVNMNIDETNVEKINIGLEAKIEVTALGKTYIGNITHIASTGNNGKFEIEIEFENDGDVRIGMTGTVSITI